jgi:flagellar hook assembly protein FlgD
VTKIYYTLPEPAEVTLNIYTIKGALVKTLVSDRQPAGYYGLNWNGTDNAGNNVSSGIYIYQLRANDQIMSRKMVLMK